MPSPIITYHHLSSPIITYHHLSSPIITYHHLSSPIITYHHLSSPSPIFYFFLELFDIIGPCFVILVRIFSVDICSMWLIHLASTEVAPILGPGVKVPMRQTYDFWAIGWVLKSQKKTIERRKHLISSFIGSFFSPSCLVVAIHEHRTITVKNHCKHQSNHISFACTTNQISPTLGTRQGLL